MIFQFENGVGHVRRKLGGFALFDKHRPQLAVNGETGPQSYNHKRMNSHNLNEFEKEPRISDVHIGFQSCGPMSKKLS